MGRLRPFVHGLDDDAVLHLIDADRLPGQPQATPDMLAEAVAGRSPIDAGWWAELAPPAIDVLLDVSGAVTGVVSYSTRSRDGAGLILWLHGREEVSAVGELIDHALSQLKDIAVVDAFD